MSVNAYLNFNGNCREVVLFYAKVFGIADPMISAFGDLPPNPEFPLPEGSEQMVMHARLQISGSDVMFSDVFPGMKFTPGNNISLTLVSKHEEEIRDAYNQLKEGGTIVMELQETFWSKCYGSIIDKFGIGWQFSLDNGEPVQ